MFKKKKQPRRIPTLRRTTQRRFSTPEELHSWFSCHSKHATRTLLFNLKFKLKNVNGTYKYCFTGKAVSTTLSIHLHLPLQMAVSLGDLFVKHKILEPLDEDGKGSRFRNKNTSWYTLEEHVLSTLSQEEGEEEYHQNALKETPSLPVALPPCSAVRGRSLSTGSGSPLLPFLALRQSSYESGSDKSLASALSSCESAEMVLVDENNGGVPCTPTTTKKTSSAIRSVAKKPTLPSKDKISRTSQDLSPLPSPLRNSDEPIVRGTHHQARFKLPTSRPGKNKKDRKYATVRSKDWGRKRYSLIMNKGKGLISSFDTMELSLHAISSDESLRTTTGGEDWDVVDPNWVREGETFEETQQRLKEIRTLLA